MKVILLVRRVILNAEIGLIEIDYREKKGWNNKNLLPKNQYVVSELRANFTQRVWESSPKSKAEEIENTKKVNYRVGQTMRQNRNMFREKGMCDK